jgi:hypothetical protein
MRVSIAEAAQRLRVSEQTVRRRIRSGELPGVRVETPWGFIWAVELPDDSPTEQPDTGEDETLREFIAALEAEIERLHVELESRRREAQQFQAALPTPDEKKPWWRRWFGKSDVPRRNTTSSFKREDEVS